jgi:hypothetical protein
MQRTTLGLFLLFTGLSASLQQPARAVVVCTGPGVPAGTQIDAQVGHIDLLPTLLDLAGLPADQRMMGQSTTPLLRGEGQGRGRGAR